MIKNIITEEELTTVVGQLEKEISTALNVLDNNMKLLVQRIEHLEKEKIEPAKNERK